MPFVYLRHVHKSSLMEMTSGKVRMQMWRPGRGVLGEVNQKEAKPRTLPKFC